MVETSARRTSLLWDEQNAGFIPAKRFVVIGVNSSRREPGAQHAPYQGDMKQYLVVKIAQQLGSLIEMIPVAGLFPLDAAEQFVRNAVANEPESLFLIQQVGNA